ncbi:hypothetical protein LAWI1_G000055 [Lachnellula willkommii]|uniref:Uncharacterized protein n=1 Tax=Lachnellula willkommii TaxID=215461 RepID=A0A559MNG0_9HELO|nr:hypothetical protein LAWI1_G000055 [Lachnellula willkommii]
MSQPNTPSESVQDPSSSINAAAQAYQQQQQQQQQQPPTPSAAMPDSIRDVVMSDSTPDRPASPAIATGATNVPSPVPARIGTPSRNTNGDVTSRATSQHPDSAPTIPKEAPPHGAPTRQYLNGKVTGVLLDGMKQLAKEQYVALFSQFYSSFGDYMYHKSALADHFKDQRTPCACWENISCRDREN